MSDWMNRISIYFDYRNLKKYSIEHILSTFSAHEEKLKEIYDELIPVTLSL